MPIGLLLLGRPAALWILIPLAIFCVLADIARQRLAWVNRIVRNTFQSLMRPTELPALGDRLVLNGATWMCVSAALCAVLFPEPIAAAALIMLIIGDAAAAIVGRRFGNHRLPNSDKSWEGSVAFLLTAFLATLPLTATVWLNSLGYAPLIFFQLGIGVVAATILEALTIPINDNLRVPLVAGLAMMLV